MKHNRIERFLSLAVCLMLATMVSAQNCHVTGRVAVPALQKKSITLTNMNTGKVMGKTTIMDSTYSFNIEVQEPFVAMLKTDPQNNNPRSYYYLRIVAEPGNIYADLVTDSLSGTPLNDRFYLFMKDSRYEVSVINALYHQINESVNTPAYTLVELTEKAEKRTNGFFDMVRNTYTQNKTNAMGALVMEDYLSYDEPAYETALEMLEGAAPVVTTYQPLTQKLASMEKLSHTAVGKPYIDLDLTDYKTGKPIKLSKVVKGKVALIDFWASWCGPCRREIPHIKQVYEKFKDNKDLVVISLNVWDKPDAQAKAIKDMGMTWTQLTDATRNATDTYGVEGIPQILLIDKDGKIIARDLRGVEIEQAVKKALGK